MQFIVEEHKIYAQSKAGERLAEVDFPALEYGVPLRTSSAS